MIPPDVKRELRRQLKIKKALWQAEADRAGYARARAEFDRMLQRFTALKGLNGSTELFLKAWDESQHPRDHGQFSSSPGGQSDGETARSPENSEDKARSLASRIAEVPAAVRRKVTAFVEAKYAKLAERYGRAGATAVLGAAIMLTPVPLPGTTLIPVALAEAVLAITKLARGKAMPAISDEDVQREARSLLSELSGAVGDSPTEDDGDEPKADQLEKGEQVEGEHTDSPEVAREIAADHLEERPDYYSAIAEAMLQYAEECAADGTDPAEGLERLRQKSDESIEKAYDESKHPRDDHGRFVSKDAIHEAKSDPAKAEELRKRVTDPAQRAKLDAALEGKSDLGRTKRGERKDAAAARRKTREEARQETNELISKFSDANAKPGTVQISNGDLAAMAQHLPEMTVAELRRARVAMRGHFGGGRKREEMVAALVEHARGLRTEEKQKKPRAPVKFNGSLYSWVASSGGIDPNDPVLGRFKDAVGDGLSLGLFKQGGRFLDDMASELAENGDIVIPDGVSGDEYLFEQLKKGASSRHADLTKQYEREADEYYAAQSDAESDHPAAEVAEAVRSGESEAENGTGVGETDAVPGEPGDASEAGLTDADTSFDVGDFAPSTESDSLDMSNLHEVEPDPTAPTAPVDRWENAPRRAALAAQVAASVRRGGQADSPTDVLQIKEVGDGEGRQQSEGTGSGSPADGGNRGRSATGGDGAGGDRPSVPFQPKITTAREQHTRRADTGVLSQSLIRHLDDAQQQGAALAVASMDAHGGHLNGDGTGIGKTRQQLAVAKTYADRGKKVLIVAPKQVTKVDWKKGTLSGSFKDDSESMGIHLALNQGDKQIEPGQVAVTSYENIGKIKDKVDKDTVVLFDESHFLKNPTSARSKHGQEIADKAHAVMFSSATPADKAIQIAHLARAGVFGTQGKTKTFEKLGMELHDQHIGRGEYRKVWRVKPGVGYREVARRLGGLFDQMTRDGLMVKRELSMDGLQFNTDHVQLTPEQKQEVSDVYDKVMRDTDGNRAVALMASRLHQEPMKIPHMVEQVKRDLAAGRAPVVFAGRVNGTGDKEDGDEVDDALGKSGYSSVGTLPALRQALIDAGVPEEQIAELHGGAKEKPEKAMGRFQSGHAKVMLATIQSGGTGVNLDDRVGNAPRSVHVMTPPLTANDMAQAIGRVHRRTTKSASNIHGILADTPVDEWNAGILHDKFLTLGAVSGGEVRRGISTVGQDIGEDNSEPYRWGGSLLDTRHYADTPAYHNELIGQHGGERVNRSGNWTTAFPSREHYDRYKAAAEERDKAHRERQQTANQQAAPRTPVHHGGRGHSFAKLRSGDWGLRIGASARPGDTVTVTKQNGEKKQLTVGRIVHAGDGYTLAEIG